MQFTFLHCQCFRFLTLRCLRLSKGNYSLLRTPCLLHPVCCWVSRSARWLVGLVANHHHCLPLQVAGGFGGQPSLSPAPDTRTCCVALPEMSCLYQPLQEWSTSEALRCDVGLPTSAFLLPHGYFSQELLGCCSWQLPLLLASHKCSSSEMCAISW